MLAFEYSLLRSKHRSLISTLLQDFPPRNRFNEFLEPLARDLDQNWPFKPYVSLGGVLNLLSRFPNNDGVPKSDVGKSVLDSDYCVVPDRTACIQGPKLYNSPGIPKHYNKASTALHMDLMDAINVSLSADKTDSSQDPVAVWHIFAANDCAKLRTYLDAKYKDDPNRPEGDLIHSQQIYFTDDMVAELEAHTGVRPWIIHQAPGDAIFIPSRCPHQVCFLLTFGCHDRLVTAAIGFFQVRNCVWTIKTAIDFLSGEALPRTAAVAEELRQHRLIDDGLEDVLQLPLVLWHAWVSLKKEMPDVMKMEFLQKKAKRKAGESDRRGTSHGNKRANLEAGV